MLRVRNGSIISLTVGETDTHLVHFVPFRVNGLVDDFAPEELVPDLNGPVRVGLAFDEPTKELVFSQQVLGLEEVDPQHTLRTPGGTGEQPEVGMWEGGDDSLDKCVQSIWRHLGNGEAELGQLGLTHQRDGDAVGQHQVVVDDVLDDVVTQTTNREVEGRRGNTVILTLSSWITNWGHSRLTPRKKLCWGTLLLKHYDCILCDLTSESRRSFKVKQKYSQAANNHLPSNQINFWSIKRMDKNT